MDIKNFHDLMVKVFNGTEKFKECHMCDGTGKVIVLRYGDFYKERDCSTCGGLGRIFSHYEIPDNRTE